MKQRDRFVLFAGLLAVALFIVVPMRMGRSKAGGDVRPIGAATRSSAAAVARPSAAPVTPVTPSAERPYRVGVIVSYSSANEVKWNGKPIGYSYEHVLRELRPPHVRCIALVQPFSRDKPKIVDAIAKSFGGESIDLTDVDQLATLDAIVTSRAFWISAEDIAGLTGAVRDRGVGLLLWGDLGNHSPGIGDPRIVALHGMSDAQWAQSSEPAGIPCTVVAAHPILGSLNPGATLRMQAGNAAGTLAPGGVPLVTVDDPTQVNWYGNATAVTPPFHVIYTSRFGRGRIVGVQVPAVRQLPPSLNHAVGENFVLRCVTWLAEKEPATTAPGSR